MVGNIIFGGISAADYGAAVDGGETFAAPERAYESVEIPGRNGTLTVDKGRYKNISIPYYMIFPNARRLESYRNKVVRLTGYHRLEDNHHPDEYRMAQISGGFEPEMHGIWNRTGEVTVTFDCKPQRFLRSGEDPVEFTSSSTRALYNPEGQPAKPLIRVYGSGTLGIGDSTVMIDAHGREYLDIDCDIQDCFHEAENLNKYMRGDFPVLGEGTTGISMGAGISKIIVWPRWWRL